MLQEFLEYFFYKKGFVLACYGFYTLVIFLHALYLTKNIAIAAQAIITTYIQMFSYGYGFLESWIKLNVLKMKPEDSFPKHFHQKMIFDTSSILKFLSLPLIPF